MRVLIKIKWNALKFSRPLMVSGHVVKRERKNATRELKDGIWKSVKNELKDGVQKSAAR
jgi:hypothetical protein